VRLKDVAHINRHVLPETTDPGYSFKYIDISAVDGRGRVAAPDEMTRFGIAPSRARRVALPGSTVVSTVRTYLRAIAQVPCANEPLVFSTGFAVIEAKPGADDRFLAYVCQSQPFIDEVVARSVGVSYPAINPSDLGNIQVTLSPLDEQRRIADFLDAETARIDQLRALQSAVRAAVLSRTVAHLDLKIDEFAAAHGTLPFRRMIRSIEQGVSPQCDNFAASPDTWGVLKVSSVKNGSFFEAENKQLPLGLEPERRYEIKHGDLLITRANTPKLVGAAAVADSPRKKLMLCDKIFRVVITEDLLQAFLVLVSLSTRIRAICAEASHGTSQSMANLKTEEIKRWPIPKAPIYIQRAAIAELSAARDHARTLTDAIDRQLAVLAERRQALITAAVTGQTDVTTARGLGPAGGTAV